MTLEEIEAAIREQRRIVFCSDEDAVAAASDEIKRLAALFSNHPDEIKRRQETKRKSDQKFWFRTR